MMEVFACLKVVQIGLTQNKIKFYQMLNAWNVFLGIPNGRMDVSNVILTLIIGRVVLCAQLKMVSLLIVWNVLMISFFWEQLMILIQLTNVDISILSTVKTKMANTVKNVRRDISGIIEITLVMNAQYLDVNFAMLNNLEITSFLNV